jgi:hypothetical protein
MLNGMIFAVRQYGMAFANILDVNPYYIKTYDELGGECTR